MLHIAPTDRSAAAALPGAAQRLNNCLTTVRKRIIRRSSIIATLDIGPHHLSTLIARKGANGQARVVAHGQCRTAGIDHGVISNGAKFAKAVKSLLRQAGKNAGFPIGSINVALNCRHLQMVKGHGAIPLCDPNDGPPLPVINSVDITRVHRAAAAVALPEGQELIEVIPIRYTVDSRRDIIDPTGMAGIRLAADVLILSGPAKELQNLRLALDEARVRIDSLVCRPRVSGLAILTEQERQNGVCVVDLGSETTEIAYFRNGTIQDLATLALGGNHISTDIGHGFDLADSEAEQIKLAHGHCYSELLDDPSLEATGCNSVPRRIRRSELAAIITPRIEEILEQAHQATLAMADIAAMPAGIVLTGGTCRLPGLEGLARRIFRTPVRTGYNDQLSGLPEEARGVCFSGAVGLAVQIQEAQRHTKNRDLLSRIMDGFSNVLHTL